MPFVRGYLHIRGAGHPDQGLPEGEHPVDPGYGMGSDLPGHELPAPPPGVWPPPNATLPIVPAPPDTPPGAIWPPIGGPPVWAKPTPPDTATPPPRPTPAPTPPTPGDPGYGIEKPSVFWVVAGIPGVGWRYVCVDPSLHPDAGLPAAPSRPSTGPVPPAEPRRP